MRGGAVAELVWDEEATLAADAHAVEAGVHTEDDLALVLSALRALRTLNSLRSLRSLRTRRTSYAQRDIECDFQATIFVR